MKKTITIDGNEYVLKSSVKIDIPLTSGKKIKSIAESVLISNHK